MFQLKGTMIVGIDTYHDSSARGRSCGGVVATTNKDFTRYYSTVTFQMSHQELQDNLRVSLNGGFGHKPCRILFCVLKDPPNLLNFHH